MANKISENITLSIAGTGFSASLSGSLAFDQSGTHYVYETFDVPNSPTALDITGISTLGYLMIKNTDATNSVDVAIDSGMVNKVATIKPGKGAYIPVPTGAGFWLKSSTGTVQVVFLAIEA